MKIQSSKVRTIHGSLLSWYNENARDFPWRYGHNDTGNPYHTWLSEIMLQQTTVITVKSYFLDFIKKWPNITDLAQASEDNILTAWQGLGYYSRARNLLKCAKIIVLDHSGTFPQNEKILLTLPGIGPYSAAAIASIAFQKKTVPVDGNVIRVMSRLHNFETPLPALKAIIENKVRAYAYSERPGDFAQGLMDLGSVICKPKNPLCHSCPLQESCDAYKKGTQDELPHRLSKPKKPLRFGKAFLVLDDQNRILLQKRPNKGLLASMMEVPSTSWDTDPKGALKNFEQYSDITQVTDIEQRIKHTFTHFHLYLDIYTLGHKNFKYNNKNVSWVAQKDLENFPLPTLMKKILKHAWCS